MRREPFEELMKKLDIHIEARKSAPPPGDRRRKSGQPPEGMQERRSGNERRAGLIGIDVSSAAEFKGETHANG